MSFPHHISASSPTPLSLLLSHIPLSSSLLSCDLLPKKLSEKQQGAEAFPSLRAEHRVELWPAPYQSFHCRRPCGQQQREVFHLAAVFQPSPLYPLLCMREAMPVHHYSAAGTWDTHPTASAPALHNWGASHVARPSCNPCLSRPTSPVISEWASPARQHGELRNISLTGWEFVTLEGESGLFATG